MPAVAENHAFIAKLDEILARYEAITNEMNDPAVATNSARIVKLAKEHANLQRMVTPYQAYKKVRAHVDEAHAIIDDPTGDAELKSLAQAELPELEAQAVKLMDELIDGLIGGEDANVDSVIMEIRAGTGGDEAAIFARDLFEIYSRYASARGFKIEVLDLSTNEYGGYREVI